MQREEPTTEDKIRAMSDLGELDGAEKWLTNQGDMTPRIKNLIEMRRLELQKARGK